MSSDDRILSHGTASGLNQRRFKQAAVLQRMLNALPLQYTDSNKLYERPLATLTTRDKDDPIIALLDAWAMVLDVLGFYQQRINIEGYLNTATERFSLRELARMIGYELNSGVAASTFLAFTVDDSSSSSRRVEVPKETRVQSIPEQNVLPQTFETEANFTARAEWNRLTVYQPTKSVPQVVTSGNKRLRLSGVNTQLQAGDAILLVGLVDGKVTPLFLILIKVEVNNKQDFTEVAWDKDELTKGQRLKNPSMFVFRRQLGCFGHNAPSYDSVKREGYELPDWDDKNPTVWEDVYYDETETKVAYYHKVQVKDADLYLSQLLPQILPNSWVALINATGEPTIYRVDSIHSKALANFGMSAQVSGLKLKHYDNDTSLENTDEDKPRKFTFRDTIIYAQSESLDLWEEKKPVKDVWIKNGEGEGEEVILDKLIPTLEPGRSLILSGVPSGQSETENEIITVASSEGKNGRTHIYLLDPLKRTYDPATVTLYGNVVQASHGETVNEVLGNGDGSKANQRFILKRGPLTYLPASTKTGIKNTLEVRVDGILWQEVPSLHVIDANSQSYIIRHNEEGQVAVTFGDGENGARLPSGQGNVQARYRIGIGLAGEVPENSLTLLQTPPLGITKVTNPIPSSGAADAESLEDIRRRATLPLLTMKRVISFRDIEYFVQAYPGISKVQATILQSRQTPLLHITVARQTGKAIPSDPTLFENLLSALNTVRGHSPHPLQFADYKPLFFNLKATLVIDPNYRWEVVEAQIKAHLQATFSFKQRHLAQIVTVSEVVLAIQAVPGVIAADLDSLYLHRHQDILNTTLNANAAKIVGDTIPPTVSPAQLLTINKNEHISLDKMKVS